MRILMLNNEFPPLGGGMGTVNQALLQPFACQPEMEIDLITSALGGRTGEEQFSDRIRIFKVPVWNRNIHHSTNRELLTYALLALRLAFKLQRERRYDFCFAWSTVPAGGVASALHRLANLPYLVWASGPDIPGFERRYRREYLVLSPLIRAIWRRATVVLVKCDGELKMIQSLESRARIVLIPNGVDLSRFQARPPIADNVKLRVLCVARLIERKGQHHLIEATKRLSDMGIDTVVSLVGTGDAQGAYERLAQELGVDDQIRFVGYVPRAELPAHYASAHVFVLPSYSEGMSLALLNAMASGLSVVVTRTGGTDELVEEGVTGLTFDWGDVDTLAQHLRRLASDRAFAGQMGAAARTRAELFGWPAIVKRYLELFTSLVPHMLLFSEEEKEAMRG